MAPPTVTAGRRTRPAVTVVLALLALVVLPLLGGLAVPAGAAGTGGIEVTPYPGVVNGRQVTAFHTEVPSGGSTKVRYSLRNTTDKVAQGKLYAASAVPDGKGGYAIGGPGSSVYLSLPARDLTLPARHVSVAAFEVHPGPDGRPTGQAYGAIVVEVRRGAVTQRAATLVYLSPGPTVPLPLLLVLVAVGLLLAAAVAWWTVRRRRGQLSRAQTATVSSTT